ncbi:hypothetical protein, partial [Paracoccus sp. (in: a-proteobacteria)]|uniref:hypothetical protein n=1 Tax=Paracoccus sp. TaxID=267 RepID=UPI003A8C01C8
VAQSALVLGLMGLSGLAAVTFIVNLMLPGLPAEVRGQVVGAVATPFAVTGLIFLGSALLICLSAWHRGNPLRVGVLLYLVGAAVVASRPLLPAALQTLDGVLIGMALLIWGCCLFAASEERRQAIA